MMANQVEKELSEKIFELLQQEQFVTLATVDHETGGPNKNALSWLLAKDRKTIRFAVNNQSKIVKNIEKQPLIAITVIGAGSTYSIMGETKLLVEKMDDLPLKLALFELQIDEVHDVMFYGSRIVTEPVYEFVYDREAAEKLDKQVMEAIRKYK